MKWLWIFLLVLTGCQNRSKPDLASLYQQHGTDHSNTPLILIHGAAGSILKNRETGAEVWPGKLHRLVFSDYENLANVIDPIDFTVNPEDQPIDSHAIIDNVSGISIYDDVIKTLTRFGNYQISDFNQTPPTGRALYIFHYDWRQDNVHSAQRLSDYIQAVLVRHPEHKQVDVLAHSMGGLITRYYLKYGHNDVLDSPEFPNDLAPKTVRHAIFLGTPQLGSVIAIKRLLHGNEFNLNTVPVWVQVTLPSIIQLLPHPDSHWLVDPSGRPVSLSIHDPALWQRNQWSIHSTIVQQALAQKIEDPDQTTKYIHTLKVFFDKQLIRAERFWRALSHHVPNSHSGHVIMGGDCKKTLSHLVVETKDGRLVLRHSGTHLKDKTKRKQYEQWLYQPGDGQVSKASLLGVIHDPVSHSKTQTANNKYPLFLCQGHIRLTENTTFQDNLLHVLLN